MPDWTPQVVTARRTTGSAGAGPRSRSVGPLITPSWPPQVVFARRRATGFASAGPRSRWSGPLPRRRYLDARGKYRIFNAAEYRFYRSLVGPPVEGSEPFATGETLPQTPAETFGDGVWYLSVSYFNGVLDSGFLPLGPGGESYIRLEVIDGQIAADPPAGPLDWRLEQSAGGVVRVIGVYYQSGANRAGQWSIAYTIDGGDPPADDPDAGVAMASSDLAVLGYELPAADDGATVKVRLQTRRNDGTEAAPVWVYSDESIVKTITADAAGPAAPIAADRWPGQLPQND